jgi:hypothetical protein
MNARRDSAEGPGAGSFVGRVLLVGAIVFAATATGLLVLTEEQRWLRLGIVAALWAALTGAFLAARYRRQLTDQRDAAAERQQIYELELEREIAARREHELEVEAEAKRKAEETSRDDIAALRAELQNMRQTLESLLGGEFLVERYALRAESTRMRSLPEDRALSMRRDVKHLPAAQANPVEVVVPQVMREAETEMIERIREVHQKPRREQPQSRPEPRVADSRPPSVPRRPERPGRTDRPTPEPVMPGAAQAGLAGGRPESTGTRMEPAVVRPESTGSRMEPAVVRPESTGTRMEPAVVRPESTGSRMEPAVMRPEPAPKRPEPAGPRPGAPRMSPEPAGMRPEPPGVRPTGVRPEPAQPGRPAQPAAARQAPEGPHPAEVSDRWFVPDGLAGSTPQPRSEQPRRQEPQRPSDPPRRAAPGWDDGEQEWAPSWETRRQEQPADAGRRARQELAYNTGVPLYDTGAPVGGTSEQTSWLAQYNQPNSPETTPAGFAYVPQSRPEQQPEPAPGRRHRVEEEDDSGGGRRRRAEGQPSWQETVSHRAEDSGSHATGRSVSELLANNGHNTSPRRRRRRDD